MIEPNVIVTVRDAKTKRILRIEKIHNEFTNKGKQQVRDLMGGVGLRADKLAIGSGTTTPTAGDTALETETLNKDIDRRNQQTYGIEFQTLIETGEANGTDINEIGLLEQSILIARAVLGATISKHIGIEVTVSHILTVS
jgi:hypothetical protein